MELDNTTIVLVFVAFVLFAISLYVIEKVEGFVGRRLPELLRYGFAIALVFVGVQAWQRLPRGYIPLFDSSESQSVIYGLPPISDTDCPSPQISDLQIIEMWKSNLMREKPSEMRYTKSCKTAT